MGPVPGPHRPPCLCVPLPSPRSPHAGASVSVDIWSVGCIMAEMITGKTLFKEATTVSYTEGRTGAYPAPGAGFEGLPCTWGDICQEQVGGRAPSLARLCVPDLGQDLDQLKEIMKVTGAFPQVY